jgi:hypothetical protein
MKGYRTIFLRLSRRAPQFRDGYRAATKDCATWLHRRADELDPAIRKNRIIAKALRQAFYDMANEAKDAAQIEEVGLHWPHQVRHMEQR